jgi:hypothetical protein
MDPSDPLSYKSSHESPRQSQILYLFSQTNVKMMSSSLSKIPVRSLGERFALFRPRWPIRFWPNRYRILGFLYFCIHTSVTSQAVMG